MNVREQFHAIMDGAPVDGMPVLEWAYWWDKTLDGWYGEGLPKGLDDRQMQDYFGLAHHKQFWLAHKAEGCPKDASHGSGITRMNQTMTPYAPICCLKMQYPALRPS